jgi:hypothetical protein
MIYIDLKGNLGNQLFEYAFARKIQEQTNQKICVNTCFLSKYKPEYHCNLNNYLLNENVSFEDKRALPWFVNTYSGPIRYIKKVFPKAFLKYSSKRGRFIWLHETYVDLPIEPVKKDYYLVGYWQSTKYFSDIDSIIRKEFTPKLPPLEHNRELYDKINHSESICVTIRRGDYVTNEKYRRQFFLCDTPFFLKGIEIIRNKIPNASVICFSDDIDWVKKNVPISGEVYYERGDDPVWEKLRLMSSCKHFVISNSSFSWWSQHLSSNPNKIVVAPSKWYPDGRRCDIYEDGWELLKV